MIFLKTEDEIELMRAANMLVADTLTEIAKNIRPGVTTKQLDALAEEFIRIMGRCLPLRVFQTLWRTVSGINLHICQ